MTSWGGPQSDPEEAFARTTEHPERGRPEALSASWRTTKRRKAASYRSPLKGKLTVGRSKVWFFPILSRPGRSRPSKCAKGSQFSIGSRPRKSTRNARVKGPRRNARALYCNPSAEGFVHGVSQTIAHAGQHVAVGVQGYGYGGVTQEFLHEFDVYSFTQQQGCAGMAQVVKTYVG